MVQIRDDYITILLPEDLDELSADDWLYIQTEDGKEYHLCEKAQIQADDDGLMFIAEDNKLYYYDYDDVELLKVKNKSDIPTNWFEMTPTNNGDNIMFGILIGVLLMIILEAIM